MEKSSSILQGLNVNMASLAGKAIDAFAVAGTAAAVGLGALVASSIESVTQQTRLADRIQISTETLGGLELAARSVGQSSEDVATFLTHMTKAIGEAENGSEEAQKTFADLNIGLVQFAGQSNDQKLKTIADSISHIADAGTRTELMMKLGGRSAAGMVGVFAGGAETLEKFNAEALESGNALNRMDSQKVVEANKAFQEVVYTVKGLITQLTVQLSPFIAVLEQQIKQWATSSNGNVSSVQENFEFLLETIAGISDSFNLLKAGFYTLRTVATAVIEGIVVSMGGWLVVIQEAYNGFAGLAGMDETHFADPIKETIQGLAIEMDKASQDAEKSWDSFNNSEALEGVRKTFKKVREDATKSAEEIAKGAKNVQDAGRASEVEKATANADMAGQKARQKELDDLQKRGDALAKSLETPLEKFTDSMEESIKLFNEGKGQISAETFARSIDKAQADFLATEPAKTQNSFKVVNSAFMSESGLSKAVEKKQEVHSTQIDKTNQVLERILNQIGNKDHGLLVTA